MNTVFIDGSAGTTGLRIRQRLADRKDIRLLELPEKDRKKLVARANAINQADVAFLCLPDEAAIEAMRMVNSRHTVIIDTSTAHRTALGWVYGFPEIGGRKARIAHAKRIANPGCHASGFIALVAPLLQAGLLQPSAELCCFSLTGYSGGGKKMIAQYETQPRDALLAAPRQYGLTQAHKHLPEMQAITGLTHAPVFCPIVGDFYSGMEVTVPVFSSWLKGTVEDIRQVYAQYYQGPVVTYVDQAGENGFLSASVYAGLDTMEISVQGGDERILLTARYDNLGKGASGAAIQNMNLVLGSPETEGLCLHHGGAL